MFTQGEWTAANDGKGFDMNKMRHIFIRVGKLVIGRIDGYKDGKSCYGEDVVSMEEATDNAHLVIAGPKLLSLLKNIVTAIDDGSPYSDKDIKRFANSVISEAEPKKQRD